MGSDRVRGCAIEVGQLAFSGQCERLLFGAKSQHSIETSLLFFGRRKGDPFYERAGPELIEKRRDQVGGIWTGSHVHNLNMSISNGQVIFGCATSECI